jgi:hypothetical protein
MLRLPGAWLIPAAVDGLALAAATPGAPDWRAESKLLIWLAA